MDDVVVGGGLVESFAFTSTEPPLTDWGQATVRGWLRVEASASQYRLKTIISFFKQVLPHQGLGRVWAWGFGFEVHRLRF